MVDAREQFERWFVGALVTQGAREIERDGQGSYILMQTRLAWQAWHAGWLERAGTPPNAPSNGAAPCAHRLADARNEAVQSGYVCVDCGAVFAADGVDLSAVDTARMADEALAAHDSGVPPSDGGQR